MLKKIVISSMMLSSSLLMADAVSLYKPCIACHGKSGETTPPMDKVNKVIIKDMDKSKFISSLKGYKAGTYGGKLKALMTAQVTKLSDANIQTLADHIVK